MNILLDVDGVLADFVLGFTKELHKLDSSIKPYTTAEQVTWDFEQVDKQLINEAWSVVKTTPRWWANLPSLVNENDIWRFNELIEEGHSITFCTDRKGTPHAQMQTAEWLYDLGFLVPNVVVSKRKGEIARAIDADFSLEDKAENAAVIHWLADAKPCKSVLLNRPYNQSILVPKHVRRVDSVSEFMDIVEGACK